MAEKPPVSTSEQGNVCKLPGRCFTVWASHREVASVLPHPRLPEPSMERRDAGMGTLREFKAVTGQTGWDIGVNFTTIVELRNALREGLKVPGVFGGLFSSRLGKREITRLAIASHGHYRGLWMPNGQCHADFVHYPPIAAVQKIVSIALSSSSTEETQVRTDSVKMHEECLREIGEYTSPGATILLMGCLAGDGLEGTALMMELSRVWRGRTIVAFATLGTALAQRMKPEGPLFYAGMKNTGYNVPGFALEDILAQWDALDWAGEDNPSAKIVVDDEVRKWPIVRQPAPNPKHLNLNKMEFIEEPHYIPTKKQLNRE